mmetsp:Transcript_51384/g.122104  ORF Transcript_51384/g.122104 Transcript_51384/m.122104 type:complete len:606 (+) Transcript_51384:96-1913(+)
MAPPAKGQSLSALQAQLRKGGRQNNAAREDNAEGTAVKAAAPAKAGITKAAAPGPIGAPQGQKRSAPEDGASAQPPPTKVTVIAKPGAAKAGVAKVSPPKVTAPAKVGGTVSKALGSTPAKVSIPKTQPLQKVGLTAKTAAAAPPASLAMSAPGSNGFLPSPAEALGATSAKSSGAKVPVPAGLEKRPAVPVEANPNGKSIGGALRMPPAKASQEAPAPAAGMDDEVLLGSLMTALNGPFKMRTLAKLAEGLGEGIAIEQLNVFLKALQKKVASRAQQDGVRVPTARDMAATANSKAVAAVKPAVPKSVIPGQVDGAMPKGKAQVGAIAKMPTTASASSKASATAQAKPASAAASPAAPSPPPSPQAAVEVPEDNLYTITGQLADDPVVVDGIIQEVRLLEVLKQLWNNLKRPKDWNAAWHAMNIPIEKQSEVLLKFLDMAVVQEADYERAPTIVADLVKSLRIKMRSIEEILAAPDCPLLILSDDAWEVYANFLARIFPKPSGCGWGWSRVGWSFNQWWQFTEKCILCLDSARAFDVIGRILKLLEEWEGRPLGEVETPWRETGKLDKILGKLVGLQVCEPDEVLFKLAEAGVTTEGMENVESS